MKEYKVISRNQSVTVVKSGNEVIQLPSSDKITGNTVYLEYKNGKYIQGSKSDYDKVLKLEKKDVKATEGDNKPKVITSNKYNNIVVE